MVVADQRSTRREEPPPGGAIGTGTAYRISDAVPARTMEFCRRILHRGAAIGPHPIAHDDVDYVLSGEGIVQSGGHVNTAAAFAASKVTVAAPASTLPWTLTAVRVEVLPPPGADDRLGDPRTLMEAFDEVLPHDGKALLTYLTFTFACERLHHQWELVGTFVRRHLADLIHLAFTIDKAGRPVMGEITVFMTPGAICYSWAGCRLSLLPDERCAVIDPQLTMAGHLRVLAGAFVRVNSKPAALDRGAERAAARLAALMRDGVDVSGQAALNGLIGAKAMTTCKSGPCATRTGSSIRTGVHGWKPA